ncbi:MAG: hypothetical protein Q4D38_10855, partial [Planctomycetia bacterium]|nr:hypothetical protein [Planctomycetia bacterium]
HFTLLHFLILFSEKMRFLRVFLRSNVFCKSGFGRRISAVELIFVNLIVFEVVLMGVSLLFLSSQMLFYEMRTKTSDFLNNIVLSPYFSLSIAKRNVFSLGKCEKRGRNGRLFEFVILKRRSQTLP